MSTTQHYKQNRLQQLRGFCAAARLGSVSKAAAELQMSQPTVSLQIQALERELKVTLFERRGPRIVLTPDGQMLLNMAQSLVRDVETLADRFAAQRGNLDAGRLDIAAGGSTILYLLPDFVAKFTAQFPGIELHLHNVTGRDGLALLRSDQADLAVGTMVDKHADMEFLPLFRYDAVLIAPQHHELAKKKRVTIADVAEHPLILPPSHLTTWGVVEKTFLEHNLRPNVKLQVGNWEVIKEYVRRGMGVSIVTSICLAKSDKLAVIPMDRYFPQRAYGVVTRRGKILSPQAAKFIEVLRS
jgi:LysR family transcriptional regulator, low CO2-responsive transcriptional regulator